MYRLHLSTEMCAKVESFYFYFILYIFVLCLFSFKKLFLDVEQISHAFLEQQWHRKSQPKTKGGFVEAIGALVLELHEIC